MLCDKKSRFVVECLANVLILYIAELGIVRLLREGAVVRLQTVA